MPAPDQPPAPYSPAERWEEQSVVYQDLLVELARLGADVAAKIHALTDAPEPDRRHVLDIVDPFSEVARGVRLAALLAQKLAKPLPTAAAPRSGGPRQAGPPEPRDPPERRDTERGDREARQRESRDRLEDPSREHNLDRPVGEIVNQITRGLGLEPVPVPPPPGFVVRQQPAVDYEGAITLCPARSPRPPSTGYRSLSSRAPPFPSG